MSLYGLVANRDTLEMSMLDKLSMHLTLKNSYSEVEDITFWNLLRHTVMDSDKEIHPFTYRILNDPESRLMYRMGLNKEYHQINNIDKLIHIAF